MTIEHTRIPTESAASEGRATPELLAIMDSEIVRAAVRCVDEQVRPIPLPDHGGTPMVLVPRVLFERLDSAVRLRCDYSRPTATDAD